MTGEQRMLRRPAGAPDPRAEAETAIERALTVLERAPAPSVDQLSDIADAIDSLKEGAFAVAADLAVVAQQRRTLPVARRPMNTLRSIPDLRAAFQATRRFLATTPLK